MTLFSFSKSSAIFAIVVLVLLSQVLWSCQSNTSQDDTEEPIRVVRQAAEYDAQAAVWLIWPPVDHLEGFSNEQVTLEIIEALLPHTPIKVTAADSSLLAKAKAMIPASAQESGQVQILEVPSEELWVRDMGPVFVENNKGEQMIADFNFDSWGYSDTTDAYSKTEELYDERVAALMGIPVISTSMISEGGDREVNGEGVLMVVEAVEQGRNPGMTKVEMEGEFQRLLGVSEVIWLKQGVYEDDHTFLGPKELEDGEKAYTVVTTNGHIDEFARFVNDSTILLAKVDSADLDDPIARENHRRMEENYAILRQAKDQNGNPFNIVRMPLPSTIVGTMKPGDSVYDFISTLEYEDGSTFPQGEPIKVIAAASYLNFLITNGAILAQKYWRPGWDESIKARDEEVESILADLFPSRKIVMIDALAVNYGGGGIHCISMHQPKLED
ncbi:MAG: agmatine deiminase family protein [Saprospiraceae bacterium]|nr:agmatine deiminase family protein [Saprospiraceae bacterium]